ncbi:glycoside hydrolase family 16 protein [Ensifer sp. MJa1]|uniref:glycoside hydrolase family 16 protein n=1 Tax=Ensifer sp. MJa1 TaxID=2919888 RepID=UPI00300A455B
MGMRFFGAAFLGLACTFWIASASVPAQASPPADGQWERVFSEEFNGSKLDRRKWTRCYWWDKNGCTNLANKELQWYRPENVSVGGGHLRLTARPQKVIGHEGRTFNYTSGMVTTGRHYEERAGRDRFATKYGYFEIRAKVPRGKGLWPAIWLLPSTQEPRPEIDILEVLGHATNTYEMHLHYIKGGWQSAGKSAKTADLAAGWHVYGLEWRKDAVIWYLDGKELWRYTKAEGISQEPMYLLINLAVGGNWPGSPNAKTKFPAEFLIDYVRVWRRTGP